MKVQLYYWQDCPSHPEAEALLQSVLTDRGLDAQIERVEVRTEEHAAAVPFPGSPTIHIAGSDVDPTSAGGRPALSCRIYRLADGRPSPIPSRQQIEEAIDAISC